MTDMSATGYKRCTKCGEDKSSDMFSGNKRAKDGLCSLCKSCVNAAYLKSREQVAERNRRRRDSLAAREAISTPTEKRCPRCQEVKPSEAFSLNRGQRDGLAGHCKACVNAAGLARRREQGVFPPDRNIAVDGIKRCYKCGEVKPSESFAKDKKTSDGLNPLCKRCTHAYKFDHLPVHPNLPDDSTQQCAVCGEVKPLKMFPFGRYSKDGVSRRCKVCRLQYNRAHRQADPLRDRTYSATRRARKRNAPGRGITAADMRAMIYIQQGLCAYCERDGQNLTLDHIIPLLQGGPHDPENGCMACGVCNSGKWARTPEQWEEAGRWFDTAAI